MSETTLSPAAPAATPSAASEPQTYVLFHKNCLDGTGAKYAAWKKFGDTAKYIPVQYGEALPEIPDGSRVYILDFSYPKDALQKLYERMSFLLVLDHHKTAQEQLADLPYAQFNMRKSGAVLAWEHFFPGTLVPKLLQHVQDSDLWKWQLKDTENVTKGLALVQSSMKEWDCLCCSPPQLRALAKKGQTLATADSLKVSSTLGSVHKFTLKYKTQSLKCGIVNSTVLQSEIGNAMCAVQGLDVAILFFITKEGQLVLSLRSEHAIDVSEIAKELGGGGHRNAAGARLQPVVLTSFFTASEDAPISVESLSCYAVK